MSDDAFEPPSEPPRSTEPPFWRRLLGLALDVLIVLIVLESWELPFVEFVGGFTDGDASFIGTTPTGPRGFGLSGRGGQIIGLGATGLALALQVPFAWRSSTLGLSLFSLQVRAGGRKAPAYLSVPWSLFAWTVSIAGLVAVIVGFAAVMRIENSGNTLGIAMIVLAVAGTNLFAAMRTGRSLLDRVLGVHLAFRDAPQDTAEESDHITGWQPRPDFVPHQRRSVDKDLHAWRTHASADPLAPIWGPDPGPMLESPEDPDHMDHVADDDPFAAVGGNVDTSEEAALAERLRKALAEEPDGT